MAINPQQKFKHLLIQLFQLDKSDLDFGIYRMPTAALAPKNEFLRLMWEGTDHE